MNVKSNPVLSTIAILTTLLLTVDSTRAKEKGDILQTAFVGTYTAIGSDEDRTVILGPFPADVSVDLFTITSRNPNRSPMELRFRVIQPQGNPVEPEDCSGPADVIGEVSSVFVSPFDSVHQTFPEGTKIPGYYANSVGLVIEATGPWCLVAFVFPPFLDGATFSGHVTFRFNDSEDS